MEGKTHWRTFDFNISVFSEVMDSLDAIAASRNDYWINELGTDSTIGDDLEYLHGLGMVAAQSYMVSIFSDCKAIKGEDFFKSKFEMYQNSDCIKNSNITLLELINALANYFKHKDEGPLAKGTMKILSSLNLQNEDYPILKGCNIISNGSSIKYIVTLLENFRTKMIK